MEEQKSRLLEIAYRIAVDAHKGQVDKGGRPYIEHPLHVAGEMESPEEKAAALLHDVLEDSDWTEQELLEEGIPGQIVDAVKLLTRDASRQPDYLEYVRAISGNSLAKAVKKADIRHNMDLTRIPNPTPKDYKRIKKYESALEILEHDNYSQ